MLDREDFRSWAGDTVREHLRKTGSRDKVIQKEFVLLNRSYTGLTLEKEGSGIRVSPVCNTDVLYDAYLQGMPFEKIREIILSELSGTESSEIMPGGLPVSYDEARDRLFTRVCSYERNREALKNVPFIRIADMAMTFHLLVRNDDGISSAVITKELTESWKITKETLAADAIRQSPVTIPPAFMPLMGTLFGELTPRPLNELPEHLSEAVVVTNREGIYGASALFCPGVLRTMAESFGGDLVILPSSIHEMILLPAGGSDFTRLREMVSSINLTQVPEEDRLTDNVYIYDAENAVFAAAPV